MAPKSNTIIWHAPNGDRVPIIAQTVLAHAELVKQEFYYPKGGESSLPKKSKKSKKKRGY